MYKFSVPIHIQTIDESSLGGYIDECKRADVHRVFICETTPVFSKSCQLTNDESKMNMAVSAFRNAGYEVGIWISGFGHGVALTHDNYDDEKFDFVELEGISGEKYGYAYCPTDENFKKAYGEAVKKLAAYHPDLIMIDDDFRINCRRYNFGCFCKNHLKKFCDLVGEEVPRNKIEELVFTGGKNKYRSAYMQMMSDSLLSFAKYLRAELDSVNPNIRMGMCCCDENWDFNGTDCISIARTFAGATEPFMRTCAAPYWNQTRLSKAIDITRAQGHWCKDSGIETFAEGDTYPRPRYKCPSKLLELFDLAVLCDGSVGGDLKYMFDYIQPWDYEKGYVDRHEKNAPLREAAAKIFDGKKRIGVRVAYHMHVFENAFFAEAPGKDTAKLATVMTTNQPQRVLSDNCIPCVFEDTGYPTFISGENARYVTENDLAGGAILDLPAAAILMERGIDTGLVSYEKAECCGELFMCENSEIRNIEGAVLYKTEVCDKAEALSSFSPYGTPAAYLYENAKKQRFYVLACDALHTEEEHYLLNYYRQSQMLSAIAWLCGKSVPVSCVKNPRLYTICGEKDGRLAVALFNISTDEIPAPVIKLDKAYNSIECINCSGNIDGDTVTLSEIPPYGFCAFEVK